MLCVVPEAHTDSYDVAVGTHGAGGLAVLCPVEHGSVAQHDLVVDVVQRVCIALCADLDGLYLGAVLVVGGELL